MIMLADIRCLNVIFSKEKIDDISNIEFFMSKNSELVLDLKQPHDIQNRMLFLTDYSGPIGLPKNVAINIPQNYNHANIAGIISSPAHITGKGSLDILIHPDSGLELLAQADELLIVNRQIISPVDDDAPGYNFKYGGRAFDEIIDAYDKVCVDRMTPPNIIETDRAINVEFHQSRFPDYDEIDICIKEKLVNIMKFSGVTNIFYNLNSSKDLAQEKSSGIVDLKARLEQALKDEKFELAAKIRDDIRKLEGNN